jgi:hypothetical protein
MKPNAETNNVRINTKVLVLPVDLAASKKITHGATKRRRAMMVFMGEI